MSGNLLLIFICNFHVLGHLLLIFIRMSDLLRPGGGDQSDGARALDARSAGWTRARGFVDLAPLLDVRVLDGHGAPQKRWVGVHRSQKRHDNHFKPEKIISPQKCHNFTRKCPAGFHEDLLSSTFSISSWGNGIMAIIAGDHPTPTSSF